jgi:hypothetical protein
MFLVFGGISHWCVCCWMAGMAHPQLLPSLHNARNSVLVIEVSQFVIAK